MKKLWQIFLEDRGHNISGTPQHLVCSNCNHKFRIQKLNRRIYILAIGETNMAYICYSPAGGTILSGPNLKTCDDFIVRDIIK